jgi:predicted transcriptional regulator
MGFSRRDIRSEVLELLKNIYPDGLTIKEVSEKLRISRSTASKYIAVLEAEGLILCRLVGKAKLCRFKGNTPKTHRLNRVEPTAVGPLT